MSKRHRRERPLIRWHGGKWMIALWVIEHLPTAHHLYVELFGGGASVMLRKPRSKAEIYNDLDETLYSLFAVLRDPAQAEELIRRLELTPYARSEFDRAYEPTPDPVEAARRTIVRSFMGYGTDGTAGEYRTGFRATVTSNLKLPAQEWATYPKALRRIVDRLKGVVLERCDAFDLIERMDGPETLFYVDPPYLPETRSAGNRRRGQGFHVYRHELTTEDHVRLLDQLRSVRGMVVLSGYPSDLYDRALEGWHCVRRAAFADGGRPRTECLWINPAARERQAMPMLFHKGEDCHEHCQ